MTKGGSNNNGQQAGGCKGSCASGGQKGGGSSFSAGANSDTMKAPGQDGYISRSGFEANPSGYFSDLHKK
uniref:Uncharacterized protein n=1 Tax=Kalanchoe fedtschenkoi TaxID=63787 RepID=A0A7N0U918_KALFE